MTWNELEERIKAVCPTAVLDCDSDGQIVIYTGLAEVQNEDELVEFVDET